MNIIHAILPQQSVMIPDGSKVYLHNLKDYGSYKETVVSDYKQVQVEVYHAMHLFALRGLDFWPEVISIINDCKNGSSPHAKLWGLELYMEANSSILNELVPEGIHGSEKFDNEGNSTGQKTFQEWNTGGDQPLSTSNDGTKVLLRTNIDSICVTQEEILIFDQFKTDNPGLNIELLNQLQLQMKQNTENYLMEEI